MGHLVKLCCVDGFSLTFPYIPGVLSFREGPAVLIRDGHLIDQRGAPQVVFTCAIRYRLPEPTRLANQLVSEAKRAIGLGLVPSGKRRAMRRSTERTSLTANGADLCKRHQQQFV